MSVEILLSCSNTVIRLPANLTAINVDRRPILNDTTLTTLNLNRSTQLRNDTFQSQQAQLQLTESLLDEPTVE